MAVQPMEGFDADPDGSPSELTFRRYKRFAQGGSGIIWFENVWNDYMKDNIIN